MSQTTVAPYSTGSVSYSGWNTGTCTPWYTTSSYSTGTYPTAPYKQTWAERRAEKAEERKERIRLSRRTLADLSEESKERFMNIVNDTYKDYKRIEEVKQFMSGVKWFFILLGLAVLWNFPRILTIIELVLKH